MKPRRVYTAEFKRKVLQEYYTTKQSQGELERKYEIGISCLCRWLKEDQARQENAFPGHGRLPADQVEMAALRRELEVAQQSNLILKKTLLLLAQDQKSTF